MMGFSPRKLMSESINTTIAEAICPKFCFQGNTDGFCPSQCLTVCSEICRHPLPSFLTSYPLQPPPPPPQIPSDSSHQSGRSDILSPLFIIILAALGATFVIVCAYVLFVKYYPSRRRRQRSLDPERDETHDDFQFLDEDRGPVIEHHIWYINTVGLQPSVINAITICKYKRDDGLIEGTECSVCLNEFQEDETLRLLPKCNHAFHIPCIDTWLRSHTNCPMCRAAIVKNTARASSSEPIVNDFEAQVENNGESNREMEERVLELGIEREEEGELDVGDRRKSYGSFKEDMDGIQPMRRSVSLDSLSASKINLVFANIVSEGNLDKQLRKVKSNSRRFMGRSSMKRSSSSTGKFSLSNHSRSQSSVLSL